MLTLYVHPLSSFSWKALIALYENGTPFRPVTVDQTTFATLKALWPIGRFPVLVDGDMVLPEVSLIIEHLDVRYPGPTRFIPADPDQARNVRLLDRFFDLYVHMQMQKFVNDRLRPKDARDPHGVAEAGTVLRTAYDHLESALTRPYAAGDAFTLADCAAAPALFYARKNVPFGTDHPRLSAYLDRLMQRPSFARVLREAEPYLHMYPADYRD